MSTSTSKATASSQSTVQTESATSSGTSTNPSEPLLEKVFLAGCRKGFMGQGPRMISKTEIKELDVADLADRVTTKVEDADMKKSITYYLGLCRIFEKAVTLFEEDANKFHGKLDSMLYCEDSDKTPSRRKNVVLEKTVAPDHIDAVSPISMQLVDQYIPALVGRGLQTDRHLMNEIDIRFDVGDMLGEFGDEFHLQNDLPEAFIHQRQIDPLGSAPLIPDNFNGNPVDCIEQRPDNRLGSAFAVPQIMIDGAAASPTGAVVTSQAVVHNHRDVSEKSTPKRKPSSPYDETPTKRHRQASPQDSSGVQRIVRRRLFEPEAPSSEIDGIGAGQSNAQLISQNAHHLIGVFELEELGEKVLAAATPKRRKRKLFDQRTQRKMIAIKNVHEYVFAHTVTLEEQLEKLKRKEVLDQLLSKVPMLQQFSKKVTFLHATKIIPRPQQNPLMPMNDWLLMPPPPAPTTRTPPAPIETSPTPAAITPLAPLLPTLELLSLTPRRGRVVPHIRVDPPSGEVVQSPAQVLDQLEEKVVSQEDDMLGLLKDMWSRGLRVTLDDVVDPQRKTAVELHKPFVTLQNLQQEKILLMEQERRYETVFIDKVE